MRWYHAERGWVPPSDFIPLAEGSDLILELGAFALHESILAASEWGRSKDSLSEPYVSVNLSARQFHDPGLLALVKGSWTLLVAGRPSHTRNHRRRGPDRSRRHASDDRTVDDPRHRRGAGRLRHGLLLALVSRFVEPHDYQVDQSFVRPAISSIHSDDYSRPLCRSDTTSE